MVSTYNKLIIQVLGHGDLITEPFSPTSFKHEVTGQRLARCWLKRTQLDARIRRITFSIRQQSAVRIVMAAHIPGTIDQ